jgi:hypothetical protein
MRQAGFLKLSEVLATASPRVPVVRRCTKYRFKGMLKQSWLGNSGTAIMGLSNC